MRSHWLPWLSLIFLVSQHIPCPCLAHAKGLRLTSSCHLSFPQMMGANTVQVHCKIKRNVSLDHYIGLCVNMVKYEWGYWHMQVLCVQWGVHSISIWTSRKWHSQWNLSINIRRDVREWYHIMIWGIFSLVSASRTPYNLVILKVLLFCAFLTSKFTRI